MTYEEALAKAVKLLRVAGDKSISPEEAATFAAGAQQIIDRFNIEAAALSLDGNAATPDEDVKDFGTDPLDTVFTTWKWRFLSVLAKLNGVKVYKQGGAGIHLIGRPSDVQTVRYFYSWLRREIDRMAASACKGNGRVYSNNFRIGCAETIAERLKGQQKATRQAVVEEIEAGSMPLEFKNQALVRVNAALAKVDAKLVDVEAYAKKNLRLRACSGSRITPHGAAREAGRKAGFSIRMQAAKASLSA